MIITITREKAWDLLNNYLKNKNLIKHSLATEAVMRSLAREKGANEEVWGITGLLHDLDLEIVGTDMLKHALETGKILQENGVNDEIIKTIHTHNEVLGIPRANDFEYLLSAGETITGLIVAAALVLPGKKLENVTGDNILRRMKEKGFARSVNRDNIKECEKAGIPLEKFVDIALTSMKLISAEIGL